MSEENNTPETENEDIAPQAPDELTMLKERAKLMGIKFSNNITAETLRKKIADKLEGETENQNADDSEEAEAPAPLVDPNPVADAENTKEATSEVQAKPLTKAEQKQLERQKLIKDSMKLVRLRIMNLNPNKKDLHGEIFTVANEVLGTVKKYIPYGEATENGYHVPYVLYEQLKERKFLNIQTSKKAGQISVKTGWVPEFALEVLPPLTKEELARLAAAQAAAGGTGD